MLRAEALKFWQISVEDYAAEIWRKPRILPNYLLVTNTLVDDPPFI